MDVLEVYINELKRENLRLTREEQKEIGRRIREHIYKEDVDKLAKSVLPLAVHIGSAYAIKYRTDIIDLISAGNMGILRGILNQGYNPKKGAFTTYITPWIKQAMIRTAPETKRPLHISSYMTQKLSNPSKKNIRNMQSGKKSFPDNKIR